MPLPMYARIKEHLLAAIEQGELKPGDQVPSENQLVQQFRVSRMTARRALLELSDAGFVLRTQGVGTFVADARPMSSLLEIRSIADEIEERGHAYASRTLQQRALVASTHQARLLGVEPGAQLFQSVLVHRENGLAVQLEDRLVNAGLVPGYLQQDFTRITPSAYLSQVAPLTEADHSVEAVLVTDEQARQLDIDVAEPCLRVMRRTFSSQGVVSVAELIHPGSRYRLGGHLNFA